MFLAIVLVQIFKTIEHLPTFNTSITVSLARYLIWFFVVLFTFFFLFTIIFFIVNDYGILNFIICIILLFSFILCFKVVINIICSLFSLLHFSNLSFKSLIVAFCLGLSYISIQWTVQCKPPAGDNSILYIVVQYYMNCVLY